MSSRDLTKSWPLRAFLAALAASLSLSLAAAAVADRAQTRQAPPIPEVMIEGRYAAEPIIRLVDPAEVRPFATP